MFILPASLARCPCMPSLIGFQVLHEEGLQSTSKAVSNDAVCVRTTWARATASPGMKLFFAGELSCEAVEACLSHRYSWVLMFSFGLDA